MSKNSHNKKKHFDHIYPSDFLVMDYYRPLDLTKEEDEFVRTWVEKMAAIVLRDENDFVNRSYQYLLKTEQYVGSYERMDTYYALIRSLDIMLLETLRVQRASFNYIFHIPFGRDEEREHEGEIRFDKMQKAINLDLSLSNLPSLLKKNPYIYEVAWRCLLDKMSSIREMVGTGIRLSLEYELRWGSFCTKECCKLPEKFNYLNYVDHGTQSQG